MDVGQRRAQCGVRTWRGKEPRGAWLRVNKGLMDGGRGGVVELGDRRGSVGGRAGCRNKKSTASNRGRDDLP